MRSLSELIDQSEPAWPKVMQWLSSADNAVEILQTTREKGERALVQLQVTTRSPMGAIALETGGILFDCGWLRFLGAGGERMRGNLLTWNGIGTSGWTSLIKDALLVAHDAVGGFFALNGGRFGPDQGRAYYWAPDTLAWEPLEQTYSDLLRWAASGNLAGFYETMRWPGWEKEISEMDADRGVSFYPPLWIAGVPASERDRRPVPMVELWNLQQDIAVQLKDVADGQEVQIRVTEDGQ